jgi:NADH dehydrogenase [ubiquinone] 1 alpha subcomplex assembly factor 7
LAKAQAMTAIEDQLRARIAATGPISIADYMAEALMHPEHGYYATRDPFGAAGDFITAPEISQMFGELIGLSLAQSWRDQGAPPRFILAELGPGRGTLMADILRATEGVAGFTDAAEVHLVETSPELRRAQALRLPEATWHDGIASLPDGPIWLVANEFFDALPIRQFVRQGQGWRERVVGLRSGQLLPGLGDQTTYGFLAHRLRDTLDGDLIEFCPALPALVQDIGRRIGADGGAALIIDYGDWRSLGDTFQAILAHAASDPFVDPGEVDLTAHVDFEAVALSAAPARFSKLTTQGVFLERLGITARARQLASKLAGAELERVVLAHRRLTHPDEMGDLFKVLALYPEGRLPPPGCDP